jgi:riboflavin biosynthesis pyrimidine reductase
MDILPPSELLPFEVLFDKSELNPALPPGLMRFTGNIGFPEALSDRPWVYSNFVQSLDGLVSFGGLRHSGGWIAGRMLAGGILAQSRHDRWMMDFLRAHADAVLCGAQSLRLELLAGPIPRGPVYRIVHPELLRYRSECLGRKKLIIVVVTASGDLRPADYRLFDSDQVEAWIATTSEGRERLGDTAATRVMVTGASGATVAPALGGRPASVPVLRTAPRPSVDLGELLRRLRVEDGIRFLLCEGGPTLYGHLARGGWVDEKFITIAPQEIGRGIPAEQERAEWEIESGTTTRPSAFEGAGFTVENAPWYRWISSRKAGDHEINRYRRDTERIR